MSAASLTAPPPAAVAEPARSRPPAAPSPEAAPASKHRFSFYIPLVSTRIAGKIIAPYLVLILILALLAVYIVTNLLTNTISERFNAKLQDAGASANAAMVKQETEFLQNLRLMTNTEGVAEAIIATDPTKLEELLLPLQVNSKMDLVDVLMPDGSMILALRSDEINAQVGGNTDKLVDPKLGATPLAQNVLTGVSDNLGDKFSGIVATSWGNAIYASAPVIKDGQVVGAIMVGTTLERGLGRLSKEALASLILYGPDGTVLAATLPAEDLVGIETKTSSGGRSALDLPSEMAAQAVGDKPLLVRRTHELKTRIYQELVGSLEIRARAAAPLGVALPATFIQEAAFLSQMQLISIFGVVVLGVLALGLSLARAITKPISDLVRATEIVATGNLDTEVKISTRDETGLLTASFNHMVSGLREREKIRNMFSQYVTGQVAEAVLRGEVKMGGERKDVTVLMSDVRSFTTLSEGLEPETLVSMLNRYFNKMIDAIAEYEGVLDKFLGDGIITEYNVPLDQTRHELRGVLTALRMRKYLTEYNLEQQERGERTIRIGIGVHSGPAVVGNVGAEGKKVEYTAMGDTVNVAARLESQTKEVNSDVVTSAETYEACKDFVDVGEAMALHVKGREKPVIAHKLIRLKPGLELSPGLIDMPLEEVRARAAAADDGGAGILDAEREASYDPSLIAPPIAVAAS
ncbi:MAG TPA: adenylate/guanylate cyclase domain-containing protein [Chloroflexota bacterium]|nr:adenylate/guanylate cyclase domain-containing protein [Chloroflexota bacterium]